jgi:hypothetical protein
VKLRKGFVSATRMDSLPTRVLVHWKKVAEALFSDSSFVAAGKRRDFSRLPRTSFTRLHRSTAQQ